MDVQFIIFNINREQLEHHTKKWFNFLDCISNNISYPISDKIGTLMLVDFI